jgi:F420-dependent oxidoreductase-like protein
MRFCLMVEGQEGITWDEWLALAAACGRLGLEGLFTSDHYLSVQGAADRGSFDAWTLMAGLAARTERLRLGTLVSPVTFRHPAHLAKAVVTADRISGGRVELGMGSGWWEEEHRTHGFGFPPVSERFDILEEQLEIVHGLFSDEAFTFKGGHYTLERCRFLPKAVQVPHPPIILGAKRAGPRMARLVARWADEFNTVGGSPDEVAERYSRVRGAVDEAGRDQEAVVTSLMTWVWVGRTEFEWKQRVERSRRRDPNAGSIDSYLADIGRDCIVGTPDRAAERLGQYADAGVQRIMLNDDLWDDIDMVELLATEVFPKVAVDLPRI